MTAPPPLTQMLTEENSEGDPVITAPWALFFNSLYRGGPIKSWDPTFTALSGTADISGTYQRINSRLVYFDILIDPNTSVSATAGTAYAEGFPLTFNADTFCVAVAGGEGAGPGHVIASSQRIYIPGLSSVSVPVTIIGVGFAS